MSHKNVKENLVTFFCSLFFIFCWIKRKWYSFFVQIWITIWKRFLVQGLEYDYYLCQLESSDFERLAFWKDYGRFPRFLVSLFSSFWDHLAVFCNFSCKSDLCDFNLTFSRKVSLKSTCCWVFSARALSSRILQGSQRSARRAWFRPACHIYRFLNNTVNNR